MNLNYNPCKIKFSSSSSSSSSLKMLPLVSVFDATFNLDHKQKNCREFFVFPPPIHLDRIRNT